LEDLARSACGEPNDPRFVGPLYLHYARRDRLTFDFITERLWNSWRSRHLVVRRDDVLDFLSERRDRAARVARWRESSRKKLAGSVLSALRDFGLLRGTQRKTLQRPVVAPEVTLHLVRLLQAEGLRGRAVLEATDWRLFLWEAHDTAFALAQLAQQGHIRFERSGRTVILEVPTPLAEGQE
jgi:hypothetical protein